MEYTVKQILEELGGLINKAQKIRDTLPIEMKRGDARHVCLSGIQASIEPIMLSYGAIEYSNQCAGGIELSKICGIKNRTNKEILDNFDTQVKLSVLVFVHFKIESLFFNILIAMDSLYSQRKFAKLVDDIFSKIKIINEKEKKDCLSAMSILRNSLHNNSINKNGYFKKIIGGKIFEFLADEPTQITIHDLIFLIDYTLNIVEEISKTPKVLGLSTPIPDLFHIKNGYT